jgi:Asp-tRNA(Asn)/Glu-tRNA(Gln) amidotransferase A subunit family amidase
VAYKRGRGATLNPHNLTHTAGGSSGGNGAALAARAAVVTLCGDSGGSCRTLAAATGTVGFRPSSGCFASGVGAVRMASFRDTVGVMARSVADVALMNNILSDCATSAAASPADTHNNISRLRIGVPANFWADVAVESLPVLDAALAALVEAGATLVRFDAAPLMALYHATLGDALFFAHELTRDLAFYLASHNYSTSLSDLIVATATPSVRAWLRSFLHGSGGGDTSAAYYDAIERGVPALRAAWAALFAAHDVHVLAVPTSPAPARPIADVEPMVDLNGRREFYYDVYGRALMADCVAGIPSISIPAGVSAAHGVYPAGLPVGLMLYGQRKGDAALLAAAAAVEAALPPSATPPAPPAVPACAGCTAKLGWSRVAYPEALLPPPGASGAGAMGYAPDAYALGFEGECALKTQLAAAGVTLPMQSPFATGEPVDWGRRQESAAAGPPAGRHACEGGESAQAAAQPRDEL